jgi:two-component system, cell cycle response regulator DivK
LDIQLPVIDGYEATRRIRAIPELAKVPIVAVTSYALSGLSGDEAKTRKPVATAISPSLKLKESASN